MMKKKVTLRQYMAKLPQGIAPSEAAELLMGAAIALRQQHNDGSFHLQISPDTVLLGDEGASLKAPTGKESDRHCAGFAAPEIYRGAGIGPAADVYSFGAVLLYAVTGKQIPNSLQREALEEAFAGAEEGNPAFVAMLRKAMAEDMSARISTMQDLICAMAYFYEPEKAPEETPEAEPEAPEAVPVRVKTGRRGVPVALMAVFCAVVAVLLFLGYRSSPAEEQPGLQTEQTVPADSAPEEDLREEAYLAAEALESEGKFAQAGIAFAKLGDYKDARERSFAAWDQNRVRQTVAAWGESFIGLKEDGTAVVAGRGDACAKEVAQWKNLVEVGGAGSQAVWGITEDGRVLTAYGNSYWGDYAGVPALEEMETWTDVVRIYQSGYSGFMGLKKDGTVVYTNKLTWSNSENYYTKTLLSEWTDIVELAGANGDDDLAGLRADGTVVAMNWDVSHWENVVSLEEYSFWNMGGYDNIIVGICADGTMYAEGTYLDLESETRQLHGKVEGLTGVVDTWGPFALLEDGTVTVFMEDAGYSYYPNEYVNVPTIASWAEVVRDWEGVKSLHGGNNNACVIGLKEDGSVLVGGPYDNSYNIYAQWTDIAAIFDGPIAVRNDGTVALNWHYRTGAKEWTDIRIP